MRKAHLLTAALIAAGLVATGCGDSSDDNGKPDLVVSAASSLNTAFTNYAEEFDAADVKLSFGGSDQLATQIRQGLKPDVYAAANTKLPNALYDDGLVKKPVVFASNALVVTVPKGSKIDSIHDLDQEGVTIAICAETVPCGEYTQKVLSGLPEAERKAIMANVRSKEPDVSGVVAKVTQKAVDAGFVYQTDVTATNGKAIAIKIPKDLGPNTTLGAAVVVGAKQPEIAKEFIDGLLTGAGKEALSDAGFGPPPTS